MRIGVDLILDVLAACLRAANRLVVASPYNDRVATYFVENFGCRATQADGAAIERQLLDRGLARAGSAGEAEVVVLNTCTVTASADQDVRSTIRRIHRENPETKILVTGCYAQRAPEELSALPGVSLVVGNSHKHEVADYALPLTTAAGFVPLTQISAAAVPQRDHRRHLRAHRAAGRAGLRRRRLRRKRRAPTSRCRTAATIAARSASFRSFAAAAVLCNSIT